MVILLKEKDNKLDMPMQGLFQKLSSGGVGCRHFFVLWGEGVLLTTCPRDGG